MWFDFMFLGLLYYCIIFKSCFGSYILLDLDNFFNNFFKKNSGLVSPKFTVTTPAKKEHVRRLRKRKTLFDETIVLSNQ